jgi:hypothetical protein
MFNQAASFLGQHKNRIQNEDVDEDQMVNAHQQLYGQGGGGGGGGGGQGFGANSLGAGAAMQALKMFTGGGGGGQGGGQQGNSQNQFVGMAMAQAGKLFDQQSGQGNVQQGTDKQSAITQAGEVSFLFDSFYGVLGHG